MMKIALSIILVILLNGLLGWLQNQPQDAGPDVPSGKLKSLSFAPFREGQSPLTGIFPSTAQINEDLRLMAEKTQSIRTYASAKEMQPIPKLVGQYGLKMIQGAWLGYGKRDNKTEIEALIHSANRYPKIVKRVIVGNEVLLRGEMTPTSLIEYIRDVKKAIKQPVSYADVWSMYMKYPQLIKEVDFITIHILPYWEDEPVGVDTAPQHIEHIYRQVQREAETIAPGKPLLIGESGWPSHGRQRGKAVPGVVNEARFIRGLIKVATENNFDYNIVEAINQPWKSELEGVAGANWGLFSSTRKQVFPLSGRVYENPDWPIRWLIASIIVVTMTGVFRKRLKRLTTLQLMIILGLLQLFSSLLTFASDELWYSSYSFGQRLHAVFMMALNALIGGLILQRSYNCMTSHVDNTHLGTRLYTLYWVITVLAVYQTFGLATNGRYLGFPSEWLYLPVAGLFALILLSIAKERKLSWCAFDINRLLENPGIYYKRDRMAGVALVFIGIALIIGETKAFMVGNDFILAYPDVTQRLQMALSYTLTNDQLLIWLACLILLAVPFWVGGLKNQKLKTEQSTFI